MSDTFNVTDMVADMVASDPTTQGLFLKKDTDDTSSVSAPEAQPTESSTQKKAAWVPDATLLEGMSEFSSTPVTYDESEIREDGDNAPLRNLSDDDAIESSSVESDEMTRITINIEKAKKRFGIAKLQIPQGNEQVKFITAASDNDPDVAAEKLDILFNDLIHTYPEFILEWTNQSAEPGNNVDDAPSPDIPQTDEYQDNGANEASPVIDDTADDNAEQGSSDVQVVINKRDVPNVSWTNSDLDKIRKARTVELNIVEGLPIEMSDVIDADKNAVDNVISTYTRKNNDIVTSLPASRYRCTITGLSYPEVLDLSNSTEMNDVDGEWKKWSIAFNHIKNVSIGPWKEYKWYVDNTGKTIRLGMNEKIPSDIDPDNVHVYTAFEDFLRHTSFMDLEFIIWKILCATCLDSEIIQIDCRAKLNTGGTCTNQYDWIYAPTDLLEMESIGEAVLEEMKLTGEASTMDAIMTNYNESFLQKTRAVKLVDSGFYVCFGHISAYKYLEEVFPSLINLNDDPDKASIATKSLNYSILTVVKEIIVSRDGQNLRIANVDDMMSILSNLSELDWQSVSGIVRLATEPYTFKYSLRGLVCPKCKKRTKIAIDNMSKMLFIAARSLSSVHVEFKTN